jgi:hypothetical protein
MQYRILISDRLTPILLLLLAMASALTAQQPDCSQWNSVAYWKGTITIQGSSSHVTEPDPTVSGTFQESDSIQLTLTNAETGVGPCGPGTQAGILYFSTGGQDLQVSFNRTLTEMYPDGSSCGFQVTDEHPVYLLGVYDFMDFTKGTYSLDLGPCCAPLTIKPIVTGPLFCASDADPLGIFLIPPILPNASLPIPVKSLPAGSGPTKLKDSSSFTDAWNINWVFSWDLTPSRPWVKVWMAGGNTGQLATGKETR